MASIFDDNEKLRQYLEGTASDAVLIEVRDWLTENPAHQEELDALEALWLAAPRSGYYDQIDSQADWEQVKARLSAEMDAPAGAGPNVSANEEAGAGNVPRFARWRIGAMAAAVLLLAVLSIFLLRKGSDMQVFETLAEQQVLILEDGSQVTLRPHSRLRYPATFATTERRIKLETGEAFFEVAHNPAQPFRIESGDALVEVKGTSFSVRRENSQTFVAVRTGKVQCTADQAKILLTPGQKAVLQKGLKAIVPKKNAPNQFSWESDTLTFSAAPMSQVIRDLSRHFSITIETGPQFNDQLRFTTQFVGESLETILAEMNLVLGIKSRKEHNKIMLE